MVAIVLVAVLAGPASSNDADVAKLLSRPEVNKALVRYGSSVAVFAHYLGACEQNYDRGSVDAAIAEVLRFRGGQADAWDRVNNMLTSIWSDAYGQGRTKADFYGWGLDRCDELTGAALRDIEADRVALDATLRKSSR